MEENWELALLAVASRELEQLDWLIGSLTSGDGETERGDVHSQISRLTGITDLAHEGGLPVSQTTRAKLLQINESAIDKARVLAFGQ